MKSNLLTVLLVFAFGASAQAWTELTPDGFVPVNGSIEAQIAYQVAAGTAFNEPIYKVGEKSYLIYMTRKQATLNTICVALNYRKATGIYFGEDERPYSNGGIVPERQIDGIISMDQPTAQGYSFTALSNAQYLSGNLPFFRYQGVINCLK